MFSVCSESFHNFFINVDCNLDKIKSYFGDSPTILTSVLQRRSCPADVVKLLLKQGADVNAQDEYGYCPLKISLQITNDSEVIRILLKEGAEVNKVDWRNKTPLLIYLERKDCSVDIVKILLDFEADVNRKDKYGYSPLTTAIRNRKDDVIQVLVERGALINDLKDIHNSPLLVTLREGKDCSVNTVKLLLANGADPNSTDNKGDSCLTCALRNYRCTEIIQALLEKGANVNKICRDNDTPLLLFLGEYFSHNCSISMVKLLLSYKADVNSIRLFGDSPLTTSLKYMRSEKIVRLLLEGGANVNTLVGSKSLLCIAFRHSSSDIVKLLLDAGSSPNACAYHSYPLNCATDFPKSGLREDILKLLLEANIDVNNINNDGRSAVCFALQHGADAKDIQLLLDASASINTCTLHSSALLCAAVSHFIWSTYQPLRKDVLQLLLNNGACVDGEDLIVLEYALVYSKYETGAIQLLLDQPGMDDYVVQHKTLLHLAVESANCRLDVIKLLVSHNVQVHSEDENQETPLHYAVRKTNCDPRVINFLLKNGSPVNAKNIYGETPLMLALKNHCGYDVLKELLLAGADIDKVKFRGQSELLLEFLKREWELCHDLNILSSYELLVKFFLLQNPEFDIKTFQHQKTYCIKKLLIFLNKCLNELEKMNSFQVGHEHTFCMCVRRDCLPLKKNYDVNKILLYLKKNTFPVFFDVISARIGRPTMEAEVKKLQVYTNRIHSMEQVYLNCDIVHKISEYLSDDDLLKFILAFYKPVNQNHGVGTSKDDACLGKRSSEPSTELTKFPKLYC